MKSKNYIKYFEVSKTRLILTVIFGALSAAGLVFFTVVWGGGPAGSVMLIVGIIGLIVSNSGRISDREYDEYMQRRAKALYTEKSVDTSFTPQISINKYDVAGERLTKKGRDGKIRSDILCTADIGSDKTNITVVLAVVGANDSDRKLTRFKDSVQNCTAVLDERCNDADNNIKCAYLTVKSDSAGEVCFPVPENDYDIEKLVENINSHTS